MTDEPEDEELPDLPESEPDVQDESPLDSADYEELLRFLNRIPEAGFDLSQHVRSLLRLQLGREACQNALEDILSHLEDMPRSVPDGLVIISKYTRRRGPPEISFVPVGNITKEEAWTLVDAIRPPRKPTGPERS